MSYDRLGQTKVRSNGRKISIFDKVNDIKADLKEIIPEVKDEQLIQLFSKVRSYYLNKKKGVPLGRRSNIKGVRPLTEIEELLFNYLMRNNLNPGTTYRWFIATRLPPDIKDRLARGLINQKVAMHISANRRRTKNSVEGLIMMEEIRTIIQKLDWK
ncbi:hypothetical protein JXA48_05165 [Candidatus Woesearchaeota archaeon]|nr:hypothetical protein [Candidatus Woesearchaeota archaeon]